MTPVRPWLRRAAYRSGGLRLVCRKRRRALTVVMFHRVLDRADPDFAGADPDYTVAAGLFDEFLGFFGEHYNVVGLGDVLAAAEGARPLPEDALLITFDDGWADNLRYAAPLLRSRGLPAVIFVAAEPVLSEAETWWQQQVFDAARRGELKKALDRGELGAELAAAVGEGGPRDALALATHLGTLPQAERRRILSFFPTPAPAARMMLAPGDLRTLGEFGIVVGLHGYTHLPLTRVSDLEAELGRAQWTIASLSGEEASATALACPHGRYDGRVLEAARKVGIRIVFTSDPILNRTLGGMIAAENPLGRISMDAAHLADGSGRLDPAAAATWLWRRPLGSARAG